MKPTVVQKPCPWARSGIVGALALLVTMVMGCRSVPSAELGAPAGVPPVDLSRSTSPAAVARAESDAQAWWLQFRNKELDMIVAAALAGNLDVAVAERRIDQAQAVVARTRGGGLPTLDASVQVDHDIKRSPRRDDAVEGQLGLEWEPDIFSRRSADRERRRLELAAIVHRRDAVRFGVSAAVVETYYGLVEQRRLLGLLEKQRQTAEDVLRLIEMRHREGMISRLDVLQQQGQLAEIASLVPPTMAALRDLELQLDLLSGRGVTPGGQFAMQEAFGELPPLAAIAVGDRLLVRRPDLLAAQADIAAADADVALAVANRMPRLTLGVDAVWIDGRASSGSPLVTLAVSLVQPLLDWGARRAETERTRAVLRERVLDYAGLYLAAVNELESTVFAEARQRELLKALQDRRDILDATLVQATDRYESGLTDYLAVLAVTQQLYAVEQRLIREHRRLVSVRVAQHRAMGGGVPASAAPAGSAG